MPDQKNNRDGTQETFFTNQNLRDLRFTFFLEKEMGKKLGTREIL